MLINEKDYLEHIGTPRHSGRFPWGSGEESSQRGKSLLDQVDSLRKQGLTPTEIAKSLNMTTTRLIQLKSIARNEQKQSDIGMAQRLSDKGMSNGEIGKRMPKNGKPRNESSIRALLEAGKKDDTDIIFTTAAMLKRQVDEKKVLDIGKGVDNELGMSKEKLATAATVLTEKGYTLHNVQIDQQGGGINNKTVTKVLCVPGTTYVDVVSNKGSIRHITEYTDDRGRSFTGLLPPISVNSKRIDIVYGKEGKESDGLIFVRPGVKDVSLGGGQYAQVRILVDNTHYLKGMAMYKDDLPAGTDLLFHTSKDNTRKKHDAMKPKEKDEMEESGDPGDPFGSKIRRQITEKDSKGNDKVTSAMNLVNEEGNWDLWSRRLSSQTLSKQSPKLAKLQLDMTFERNKLALADIKKLTNPTVRRKLLETYASEVDSSAVKLHAAALPRSNWQVLLPMNSLKPNEIYAPNYNNGEIVALIRYPHGGTFEIPELVVNNRHMKARKTLGQAKDCVAVHSKVAERLSGADFDGDAVLVIPNDRQHIKTTSALEGLKGFDPIRSYPKYDGMTVMSPSTKATQMGLISNLITDMTLKGAGSDDLVKAIRHSMVVIDAEKHELNYKESARVNGITNLRVKYQDNSKGAAATLISRAKSRIDVPEYKLRKQSEGGPVDKDTGELVKIPTGSGYIKRKPRTKAQGGPIDEATGKKIYQPLTGNEKLKLHTTQTKRLVEAKDARTLVSSPSGTAMERVYADHSNRLKALANEARLEAVHTKPLVKSPSARVAYKKEVDSLNGKLNLAATNAPLERRAQIIAHNNIKVKRDANPHMDSEQVKKLRSSALKEARLRAHPVDQPSKQQIKITPSEWDAIQAGAITNYRLTEILRHADIDQVKKLATPKRPIMMTSAKQRRAMSMLASGYTQAEVASQLGVSLTTLKTSLVE